MAERPYRWVRVKSFANLTLQRIVDKPFMQEFLFGDTCTNLNVEAAEIKLREPIRTGFDHHHHGRINLKRFGHGQNRRLFDFRFKKL